MSRAKVSDNLNAVQLFPFVAVLLCTMGSLLVLLVGVARSSRDRAHEEAVVVKSRATVPSATEDAIRRKLGEVSAHIAELNRFGEKANEQLRNDQSQLSHLEDHMRRLQAQLDALRLAAVELNSLEVAHYDDRELGERELARLQELIAERQEAIDDLQTDQSARRRAYSILPSTSPNGTRRPPICFECRASGVFLQPEGINFTRNDFRGPPGPGNPIAAAFRAAREHMVQENQRTGTDKESEPYALVVVRPGGQAYFQEVLQVLEASGIDFGYEIIELDATINYPSADPRLAGAEQQAILTARGRMEMLALAAPDVFENAPGSFDDGDDGDSYADDDEVLDIDGTDSSTEKRGTKLAIDSRTLYSGDSMTRKTKSGRDENATIVRAAAIPTGVAASGTGGVAPSGASGVARASIGRGTGDFDESESLDAVGTSAGVGGQLPLNGSAGSHRGGGPGGSGGNQSGAPGPIGLAPASGPPTPGGSVSNGQIAGATSARFGEFDPNALPANERLNAASSGLENGAKGSQHTNRSDVNSSQAQKPKTKVRGKDWAIRDRTPGSVPIRRTIRVAVRGDSLAILPEQGVDETIVTGREVPLVGPTYTAREDFAAAIEGRIQQWGMAGQGLHWRPVIEMVVGPDGQHRADDLGQLLKGSGIEVRSNAVAQNVEGDNARANR